MHPLVIAAIGGGAYYFFKGKRKKRGKTGMVGARRRCSKCARVVNASGMVGACCSSCAHGGPCESDSESDEEGVVGRKGSRGRAFRKRTYG